MAKTSSRRRWAAFIIGACTAAAALAAAGVAVIPGPDGIIHACFQQNHGQLRVVEAGSACLASESALSWDQTGPAGPPGSTGAAGPAGPPGPPGISGLVRIEDATGAVNSDDFKSQGVACPVGKQALGGGGWVAAPTFVPVAIKATVPQAGLSGWSVQAQEMVPTSDSWGLILYVVCATVA
jgi:hypothetical protein